MPVALTQDRHQVIICEGNANTQIVREAIDLTCHKKNVSVRRRHGYTYITDAFLEKQNGKDMTFEAKKNKKKNLVNVRKVMTDLSPLVVKNLLFIPAWSGCATTSAIFNQGKTMVMKMIDTKNSKVLKVCQVFNLMEVTPKAVTKADLKMFLFPYGDYFDLN